MSIHDGHRERLKERFRREGVENFTDVQMLEFLLFYIIPRRDTNEIAHNLLDRFGSFSQVLEAPVEQLAAVPGMGQSAATFLSMLMGVSRYYDLNKARQNRFLMTNEECGRYMLPLFKGKRNEHVYMLYLDAKCRVLGCNEVGQGSINFSSVPIRNIVEKALAMNATTVYVAHNHPSGVAFPSVEDRACTLRLATALYAVDITLADHFVIAEDDYVSMLQSNYYCPKDMTDYFG